MSSITFEDKRDFIKRLINFAANKPELQTHRLFGKAQFKNDMRPAGKETIWQDLKVCGLDKKLFSKVLERYKVGNFSWLVSSGRYCQ